MELAYIYCCTVKPRDIWRVKNALVKSVYYVLKYTSCNILSGFLAANHSEFLLIVFKSDSKRQNNFLLR